MTITDEAREAWKSAQIIGKWGIAGTHAVLLADAIRDLTAQLMESEFKREHVIYRQDAFGRKKSCVACELKDPRHDWTTEQWERAAEEELSK